MMKKIVMLVASALLAGASVVSAKQRTNLIDKIPSEGYTGTVGVEINAPTAYSGAGYGLTTVHGFMLKPTIFLGAGVSYIHSFEYDRGVVPIFLEGRKYFTSQYMRRIYPHIGLRLGGQIATEGGGGFYSQLACGFRVPLSEQLALNVEVGPMYAGKCSRELDDKLTTANKPFKANGAQFSFFGRITFEF